MAHPPYGDRMALAPVPKRVWGPRRWYVLHCAAIAYPLYPTMNDIAKYRTWLEAFIAELPCPDCKMHARAYVWRFPPDLRSSEALQSWTWRFHNSVNRRLGKREIGYDEYLAEYGDEIQEIRWLACAGILRPF